MRFDFDKEYEACRLQGSLFEFIKFFYPLLTGRQYLVSSPICRESHQTIICRSLVKAFRLQLSSQRLMINVSPGSGKSTFVSMWVAWAISQYPDSRFLYVSYSKDLSSKHTETIRRILQLPAYKYLFDVEVRQDARGKELFQTTAGGMVAAVGSSGTVTGLDAGTPGVDRFSGCFIAGTKVSMADGLFKDINNIVENDFVLAYNHSSNIIEPKKVLAVTTLQRNNIIEVEFKSGIKVTCTDNHRFYDGQSYKPIQQFSIGDTVFSQISSLASMQSLQKDISKTETRNCSINTAWTKIHLLLQKLQLRICAFKPSTSNIIINKLSNLSEGISSIIASYKNMFCTMCRYHAFSKNARIWKFQLQRFSQRLFSFVRKNETFDKKSGRQLLSNLYFEEKIACTPYRSRQTQQFTRKSSNDVSKLSHNTSQILPDTISSIKKVSDKTTTVYDIQVEERHNFFANGILVHNSLIIDDPIKPDEALSEKIRESVIANYRETLQQRIRSEKVPIVFIGQRVHESDLCDYLLKGNDGYNWEKVVIKSIDDAGNAMYPEVNSLEMLLNKQKHDPYVFYSQYQQEPVSAGNSLFKTDWFPILDEEPTMLRTFITADTAETSKSWNDATVFSFWGVYEIENFGRKTGELGIHWLDCVEMRIEPKDLREAFIEFYANCTLHPVPPLLAAIEKKSTGVTLVSVLRDLRGVQIREIERTSASGSKAQRFLEIQPYIASKRVSFTKNSRHIDMCLAQATKVNAAMSHRFDDIIDTLADAVKIALIEKTLYNINKDDESRKNMNTTLTQGLRQKIRLGQIRYGGHS